MSEQKKNTARVLNRENILMTTACITLFAAIAFATAGFIVSPVGEIHDSVQWVVAQFLLYTGSALGIATYTYYGFKRMQTRLDHQLRQRTGGGHSRADYDDFADEDFPQGEGEYEQEQNEKE